MLRADVDIASQASLGAGDDARPDQSHDLRVHPHAPPVCIACRVRLDLAVHEKNEPSVELYTSLRVRTRCCGGDLTIPDDDPTLVPRARGPGIGPGIDSDMTSAS